jgi:hypothetical protein
MGFSGLPVLHRTERTLRHTAQADETRESTELTCVTISGLVVSFKATCKCYLNSSMELLTSQDTIPGTDHIGSQQTAPYQYEPAVFGAT